MSASRACRKRFLRSRRWCSSQPSSSGKALASSAPKSVGAPSKSCVTSSVSASKTLPLTRSRPACLRKRKRRWRKALRAADGSLPGHSNSARRSRGVAPCSANQASSKASRVASAMQRPSGVRHCGASAKCSVVRLLPGLLSGLLPGLPVDGLTRGIPQASVGGRQTQKERCLSHGLAVHQHDHAVPPGVVAPRGDHAHGMLA